MTSVKHSHNAASLQKEMLVQTIQPIPTAQHVATPQVNLTAHNDTQCRSSPEAEQHICNVGCCKGLYSSKGWTGTQRSTPKSRSHEGAHLSTALMMTACNMLPPMAEKSASVLILC